MLCVGGKNGLIFLFSISTENWIDSRKIICDFFQYYIGIVDVHRKSHRNKYTRKCEMLFNCMWIWQQFKYRMLERKFRYWNVYFYIFYFVQKNALMWWTYIFLIKYIHKLKLELKVLWNYDSFSYEFLTCYVLSLKKQTLFRNWFLLKKYLHTFSMGVV